MKQLPLLCIISVMLIGCNHESLDPAMRLKYAAVADTSVVQERIFMNEFGEQNFF